ncbi:DEAD/DEAH box helicase [Arcticibacter eurypsychrophilus]|uniref:DEAD/DEAH box helicase n=1 Tax=Arcticibacter eurypsychrophilus TaxID=1434752 RepID=UPI0009F27DA9|nr:DEAD/DEAH box helicase [Arcticibacter eurypsychrophilus]
MIKKALENLNISALNAMQEASLKAPEKRDVLLFSPTGSGKTLGFLLPLLRLLQPEVPLVQALILVPSRELALQIEQVFRALGSPFKITCCYGGHSTKIETNSLIEPPAVLIGTPGRIAYHLRREGFDTKAIRTLILDEFDKALEFGFQDDMSFIIKSLPGITKRMLLSATKMAEIPTFTGISNPIELNYLKQLENIPLLTYKACLTDSEDKLEALFSLICMIGNKSTLVFCNHRDAVARIGELLDHMGIVHGEFHGGMEQEDRERTLLKFRNGTHRLLITTDLASRGLDIPEIENVIHYQLPLTQDAFVHRNGRTARMHASGTSYLLLTKEEIPGYLNVKPEMITLPKKAVVPPPTDWDTIYIAAGKKDKVNKIDIVGLLLQKCKLSKDDVGLIEVLDHSAYVAVRRDLIQKVVRELKDEKIKNKKVKIEISN